MTARFVDRSVVWVALGRSRRRWGAVLVAALLSGLLGVSGAGAAQEEPPLNRITVDVSWPDSNLVYVSYEIRQGPQPGVGSGDGPYGHGCASLPGGGDTTPNRLEISTTDNPPGEYYVAAWYTNWCLDYSEAGAEEPDPLGAAEEYPQGSPIRVTATITYWAGDEPLRTEQVSGTTFVDKGGNTVDTFWAVLATVVLSDPTVTATGEVVEDVAPGEAGSVESGTIDADAGDAVVPAVPPWLDPTLGSPPIEVAEADSEPTDVEVTVESGTSAVKTVLVIMLLLTVLFGAGFAVNWGLRVLLSGTSARDIGSDTIPATEFGFRPAFDPDGNKVTVGDESLYRGGTFRPLDKELMPPGGTGDWTVHVTEPSPVYDHKLQHRYIGVLQPDQPYRALGSSGRWTLIRYGDRHQGWVETTRLRRWW